MAMIGEDLLTILGIMPVRDRAGIARSNMAVEATKSAQAAPAMAAGGPPPGAQPPAPQPPSPQAPPQFKVPQELMGEGGQLQLPGSLATAFTGGKASAVPPVTGGTRALTAAPAPPGMPAGQERVIAAAPAAAPSPAIRTSAADIMEAQMERNRRQQQMLKLVGSLGMIANGFNRDPHSAASTQASLAQMVGGGGRGGHGTGDNITDLKTLFEMREKEQAAMTAAERRKAAIDYAVKVDNLTPEDAAAQLDLGVLGKRFEPEELRKREEGRQMEGVRAKLRPKIKELAALTGADPDVLAGELDTNPAKFFEQMTPKMRADVEKTLSETDKIKLENLQTSSHMTSWAGARKNPEEFMKRYNLTPDQAASVIDDFGAYRDFLKTSQPTHDELQRRKRDINAEEKAAGKPLSTTAQVIGMGKETPDLETQLQLGAGKGMVEEYQTKLKPKAEAAKQAIEGRGMIIGDMFSSNLRSGSKFSQLGLDVRKTIATTLKIPMNDDDLRSEAFFAAIKGNILERESTMKGTLSDSDMRFLASMNGNMEQRPETIRTLQHIEEKLHRAEIEAYRERYERDQGNLDIKDAARNTVKQFKPVEQPKPTKITDDLVKEKPKEKGKVSGLETVRQAVANGLVDDPEIRRQFERQFGKGLF